MSGLGSICGSTAFLLSRNSEISTYLFSLRPRLVPGRDVAWVMCGKIKTNEAVVTKECASLGWKVKEFILHYDTKMMQQMGHFTRMRGLGNAGSAEKLLLCYKGQARAK